jgi:hypothetical protein
MRSIQSPTEPTKLLQIRVPASLFTEFCRYAHLERRSMNAQAVTILEEWIRNAQERERTPQLVTQEA